MSATNDFLLNVIYLYFGKQSNARKSNMNILLLRQSKK